MGMCVWGGEFNRFIPTGLQSKSVKGQGGRRVGGALLFALEMLAPTLSPHQDDL